jgi:hypothetical protein
MKKFKELNLDSDSSAALVEATEEEVLKEINTRLSSLVGKFKYKLTSKDLKGNGKPVVLGKKIDITTQRLRMAVPMIAPMFKSISLKISVAVDMKIGSGTGLGIIILEYSYEHPNGSRNGIQIRHEYYDGKWSIN